MKVLITLISIIIFVSAVSADRLVRVHDVTAGTVQQLLADGYDVANVDIRLGYADLMIPEREVDQLSLRFAHYELLPREWGELLPENAKNAGYYYSPEENWLFWCELASNYSDLVDTPVTIGQSYQSRDIYMIKMTSPVGTGYKPPIYFSSLIHAREPGSNIVLIDFAMWLTSNYDGGDTRAAWILDNTTVYFVPVANPDGYEYNMPNGGNQRKNMNWTDGDGVDLNRNWGYMWGYDDYGSSPDPEDETYRGMAPFSEPETSALRQFINSHDFSLIMNLHTYGDLMLYPWGYYDGYTPDNDIFHTLSDSACAQNGYEIGTPWELLYNTNGDANDWQYGEQIEKPKIFGFVMEIGSWYDGFWPDPSRIPELWNDVLPALMYLSRVADNPYIPVAPRAPILNPIGDVYSDSFTVSWEFSDTLNPAIAFELKELIGLERVEDDFEDGTSNWALDGFYRSSARRHSGSYSLYSGSDNNYNGSAILVNPISVGEDEILRFWTWYNIELNWDYAYVQLSTDGGNSFANLEGNITTNYNPHGNNQGNGITGNSGGWVLAEFPLDDYAGQSVLLGMRYVTDGWTTYDGFYADEFYPVETFDEENILSSDIIDTFYLVSDRQPGDYYYQVRAKDAEDQWSVFSNTEVAHVHPQTGIDNDPLPVL
ncbi:MAG: immune inhibitor A, partial [Candidatus Aegiribacteria sp.]|nr:immune inhibitor A [Candidatus Aegiribacteria sp.]